MKIFFLLVVLYCIYLLIFWINSIFKNSSWKSKNEAKALRAVEKITGQKKLARIAKKADNWTVGEAAVKKLTDQSALANVAKNARYYWIGEAAAKKLTDQSALADVAKNAEDRSVREVAIAKLTDQSVLADVAKNAKYSDVREVVVEKLTDQSVLADIAKNDKDIDIRIQAIQKLTKQKQIEECALILLQSMNTYTCMNSSILDNYSKKWARALIRIAIKSPQPLKIQWKQVKIWIESLHEDENNHSDKWTGYGSSSDCHGDSSTHTDSKAAKKGIIFPPYPFED